MRAAASRIPRRYALCEGAHRSDEALRQSGVGGSESQIFDQELDQGVHAIRTKLIFH